MNVRILAASTMVLSALPASAQQAVPTTQPAVLNIIREIEKPGHFAAHYQTEVRWAALNRSNNYPAMLLALSSVSGPKEVWWVSTFTGMDALGKADAFGMDNPSYTAAVGKIAMEDGEHLTNSISTQLEASRAASYGTFPDVRSQRVYQILTVTTRPGGEAAFIDVAQRFAALMSAKGIPASWRSYQVVAGAPSGTFMVFSSYTSWDAVEASRKAIVSVMAESNSADVQALNKATRDGIVSMNSRYFTVSPGMSLVPKEWLSDPFWSAK
jgi:hypothetical protein